MKVCWTDSHALHDPPTECEKGYMIPFKETPARVLSILDALRANNIVDFAGFVDHGVGPIRKIHSAEYVKYLEEAYAAWVDIGNLAFFHDK